MSCTPQRSLAAGSGCAQSSAICSSSPSGLRSQLLEHGKKSLHIRIARTIHACPASQGYPGTFHPLRQRDLAVLPAQGIFQYRKHARCSSLSILTEQRRPLAQQGKDRRRVVVSYVAIGKDMQIFESKAAPGRTQHAEPGDAIHGMLGVRG